MPLERKNPPFIILSPPPLPLTPSNNLDSSFPIVTISIIGIIATAILLLSYYAFVTKCCLNWQQTNTLSHLHRPRRRYLRHSHDDIFTLQYSVMVDNRGLDEFTIQAIPTFRYQREQMIQGSFNECAVCLNDFKERERVRLLPNCLHIFHIDCIDVWLQTHVNCPLCRAEISTNSVPFEFNSIMEDNQNQNLGEMERIEIEVRDDEVHQKSNFDVICYENEKIAEQGSEKNKFFVYSMGDECIDRRSKGGDFGVQPIRRSFSMDSSNNRELYIAVQEILQKNPNLEIARGGEENSSARVRRLFFSFGNSRSSKNAVLPIQDAFFKV